MNEAYFFGIAGLLLKKQAKYSEKRAFFSQNDSCLIVTFF